MGWKPSSFSYARAASACAVLALACGLASRASGQNSGGTTLNSGNYAFVQNNIVKALMGESGTDSVASLPVAGRFWLFDLQPQGSNQGPFVILYGPTKDTVGVSSGVAVPGSFIDVRIDGGAGAGTTGNDLTWGDTNGGKSAWLTPPTPVGNEVMASWATVPTAAVPAVEVDCVMTVVHDMVALTFTVYNGIPSTVPPTQGSSGHTVGLRFAQHYWVDQPGFSEMGPVIFQPGPQVCTEQLFVGSQVPTSWYVNDPSGLLPVGGILEPTSSLSTVTPVNQFLVANANNMSQAWTPVFSTLPGFNICTQGWDAMVASYYNPVTIGPGQSQSYTMYYGRRTSTIDFSAPWDAGVSSPPVAPVSSTNTPQPFTVTGFIDNPNQLSLSNLTATISLPQGLALAATTPAQAVTQTAASLAPNGESSFSWQVVSNGQTSGQLTYSVSFSAQPGTQGKVVSRTITVPALPTQSFVAGLQMVSFPFVLQNPNPSAALGLPTTSFDLLNWNGNSMSYVNSTQILPAVGYWLDLQSAQTITLQNAAAVPTTNGQFNLSLTNGWNMIGDPFNAEVAWQDAQIVTTDPTSPNYLQPLSIQDAATAGMIQSTLFAYDPTEGMYTYPSDISLAFLEPYQGYWVEALQPNLELLIPAPTVGRATSRTKAAAKQTGTKAVAASSPNAWTVRLMASNGKTRDGWNFIGMAPTASDTHNSRDLQKPPAVRNSVTLGITHTDWGKNNGLYTQDIRGTGGSKTWNMTVTSPAANQNVTVTWPDVASVPRTYELYIKDMSTGQTRSMRQTASLTVNTGSKASRDFVITAQPRAGAAGALMLTPTTRAIRSGLEISVTSSTPATVNINVRSANGQTIRNVVTGRAVTAVGPTTLLWDYRDSQGRPVGTGQYLIEVVGTTADGQSARQVIPQVVVR